MQTDLQFARMFLNKCCLCQDTWLVAPEKDNAGSHLAISALARALFNLKQACIIRFVPRANMAVFVGCATPLLGNGADRPDCLILNYLPFTGMLAQNAHGIDWYWCSQFTYHHCWCCCHIFVNAFCSQTCMSSKHVLNTGHGAILLSICVCH